MKHINGYVMAFALTGAACQAATQFSVSPAATDLGSNTVELGPNFLGGSAYTNDRGWYITRCEDGFPGNPGSSLVSTCKALLRTRDGRQKELIAYEVSGGGIGQFAFNHTGLMVYSLPGHGQANPGDTFYRWANGVSTPISESAMPSPDGPLALHSANDSGAILFSTTLADRFYVMNSSGKVTSFTLPANCPDLNLSHGPLTLLDSGAVVGACGSMKADGNVKGRVFTWDARLGVRFLPSPLFYNVKDAYVRAVSGSGHVVGEVTTSLGANRLVVWHNGTVKLLPAGQGQSVAGVTSTGVVFYFSDNTGYVWENGTRRTMAAALGVASNHPMLSTVDGHILMQSNGRGEAVAVRHSAGSCCVGTAYEITPRK